jgi:ornithine cyclodeaminase
VFVEYEPQSRIEGEIQQMPADFAVVELWRVLSGQAGGRRSADEITVFDSVGFALEDFSTLNWLRDTAGELGLGRQIALIPELEDPKNLFGALRRLDTATQPPRSWRSQAANSSASIRGSDAAQSAA